MASISSQIFNFATNLMQSTGYPGIFVLMVMESATLPIPSEVVLPFAGYLVYLGKIDYWIAVVVASAGSLVGTLIDYYIGYYIGRAAVARYGRLIHLSESRLNTAETWFEGRGEITVLLARFVPLIRTLIAFPAGVAHMGIGRFVVFSLIGIVVWDAILIYLGFEAGQNSSAIISGLSSAFTPIEIVAVIVAVGVVVWLLARKRTPQ